MKEVGKIKLYKWQKEAITIAEQKSGIIEAVTGSGKTMIGLELMKRHNDSKFLIVVPTIVLMKQWKDEIIKFQIAKEKDISLIGGGHSDVPKTRITIGIVNSLRKVNWGHPLSSFDYVILDECHRYASSHNIEFLIRGKFGRKIGLTATLERSDGREELLMYYIGEVLYRLQQDDAKNMGYVADFEVEAISCRMGDEELGRYMLVSQDIRDIMAMFNYNYKLAVSLVNNGKYNNSLYKEAVKLMRLVAERKKMFTDIESKRDAAIKLVMANRNRKVILFDELKESSEIIYNKLVSLGMNAVLYHSGLHKWKRDAAIRKFKDNEANILVSVRALDEGLDVKDADVGIIVNGNSQKRQIIQRLGRILRKRNDKVAKLYILFVPGTKDEDYMRKKIDYIKKSANNVMIKNSHKSIDQIEEMGLLDTETLNSMQMERLDHTISTINSLIGKYNL